MINDSSYISLHLRREIENLRNSIKWLVRVTLVVAFGFLPQNFGRWWGPTYCHFAQKGTQLQWS